MSIFGPSVEKKTDSVERNFQRSVGFIRPTELRSNVSMVNHSKLPILIEWNSSKNQPSFQFMNSGFVTLYASCIRGGLATYSLASATNVIPTTRYVLSPDFVVLSPEFTCNYVPMRLDFGFYFYNKNIALNLKGSILGSLGGGICYEIEVERL